MKNLSQILKTHEEEFIRWITLYEWDKELENHKEFLVDSIRSSIRSSVEEALQECRPEGRDKVGDEWIEGYDFCLSAYDQKVKDFLK